MPRGCPNCGSGDIFCEKDRFIGIWICSCNDCGHTWEED